MPLAKATLKTSCLLTCLVAVGASPAVGESDTTVTVVLSGYSARINGPDIRTNRGQITHWHSTECSAEWELNVAEACEVEVIIDIAVIAPFEGSRFEVAIGETRFEGTMSATNDWEDYRLVTLGKTQLPSGTHRVRVRPLTLADGLMGNVRSVRVRGAHLQRPPLSGNLAADGPIRVVTTSKDGGDRLEERGRVQLSDRATPDAVIIAVDPRSQRQEIEGFGGAFTESAAMVWSQLSESRQRELIHAYFDSDDGNGYTLCRTHINSCDFSRGNYAYTEVDGDYSLEHFSIARDREYLIPLIHAAFDKAGPSRVKLLASPWSPPAWMKTNGQMTGGGKLKPECRDAWARYYCRYIDEYEREGINIWGITVQNEPAATQRWESCRYTAEEERDFVRDHLGPTLHASGRQDVKLLVWDHNRDLIFDRASCVFDDPEASQYVWGAGFHWYVSDDYHHVQMVQDFYPDKKLLFTEGCLEGAHNIGVWSSGEHYARSIINDLNSGAVGWIDWNLLLNMEGGPNHVGNFCAAPIVADVETDQLTYNNSYHYIGHFSRFIRPGARRVLCQSTGSDLLSTAFKNLDGSIAVVVLNEHAYPVRCALKLGTERAELLLSEHSITTLIVAP